MPVIIAGPCVIESAECLEVVARELVCINQTLGTEIIFKASFDKANRTSLHSYRGPGLERGLQMLADVKARYGLRLLTDIHEAWQAAPVAEVVDVLQIPAFLCRQTDLLVAAAKTGKTVNIKKAQFLSGLDMEYPVQKVWETMQQGVLSLRQQTESLGQQVASCPGRQAGLTQVDTGLGQQAGAASARPLEAMGEHCPIWLTERGNVYGYNNLVVDFRNIADMRRFTPVVVMDCTHSVQRPGAAGGKTGGNREFVPAMALAAKAFGATGYFFETHPDPDHALSDGPNMLHLSDLEGVVRSLL